MSAFISRIPRSKRSDNLAGIFGMGASGQSQNITASEACRRDFESLDQLSRLHSRGDALAESQAADLKIAAQTPIIDPEDQDDFDHLAASGPTADSDDGYADISENDYDYENVIDEDLHYDSLQKRSPALINPSYFDAVRTSPSQGFGFSSSRYLESSQSSYNLTLDDFEFEDDNFEDIPRQAGGFGPSGFERSPNRSVLAFGEGSYYIRNDPPIQILDIPMPDLDVLEQLARAPAREGKDSPFRSYYGYEPVLTDIHEDSEPESDSGPRVSSSPPKNRHVKRSRSLSIAKMHSSPFAPRESPQPESGSKSPTINHKESSESLASQDSEISGVGTLQKIEQDDEDAVGSEPMPPFVCVKTPAPFVASNSPTAAEFPVPLPFDFPDTGHQPLPIAAADRVRLLDEPSFIGAGDIPQDYVRFEEPQRENCPSAACKPATSEPQTSKQDISLPEYSNSEESTLDLSQPQKLYEIPLRASSLNATPRSFSAQDSPFNTTPRHIAPGHRSSVNASPPQYATSFDHESPYNGTPRQDATSPVRNFSPKAIAVYMTPAAMSSYDVLESSVTGMSLDGAVVQSPLDPFSDSPKNTERRVVVNDGVGHGTDEPDAWSNRVMANMDGTSATFITSPVCGVNVPLLSATSMGTIAGTNATSIVPVTAFGTAGDLLSPTLMGRIRGTDVGSVTPRTSPGKASRIPLLRPIRTFNGSYSSINKVINRDVLGATTARSPGAQSVIGIEDLIKDEAGVKDEVSSINGAVFRFSPMKQRKAVSPRKPESAKPVPRYSIFPQRAVPSRTPSQGSLECTSKLSINKTRTDNSSNYSSKDSASKDNLGLNKPLPVSPGDGAPAASLTAGASRDISPNFPGIPALQRSPSEKLEVARVRRFASSVKKRLTSFWNRSDEALAVKQAADRERRAESALRLKSLAQHMDAQTPKRESGSIRFASPIRGDTEVGEIQVPPSPTIRRSASAAALAAAMGFGGRRKSVGQNNWVNAA